MFLYGLFRWTLNRHLHCRIERLQPLHVSLHPLPSSHPRGSACVLQLMTYSTIVNRGLLTFNVSWFEMERIPSNGSTAE
jgi:hypothetical protein